ncbi:MAG: nucleoside triphosphate pyrophosphohydrolase [Deltaproteobacteria bacterium]|nr:nucleoside triphosphate pyrophosphohydrolase [Deltaproteobacteria bacterium]
MKKQKKTTPPADLTETGHLFTTLCKTIATLRDPVHGCPWDLEQTHKSLIPYMIEEAYEAAKALEDGDSRSIADELGDVLLQVLLNAQIASDHQEFSINDIIQNLHEKMIRRHPHIFSASSEEHPLTSEDVRRNWQKIKEQEKKESTGSVAKTLKKGYFDKKEVGKIFPSTTQARKIGELAKQISFDWSQPQEVFAGLLSEVDELKHEWEKEQTSPDKIKDEIGDLYFSLAQLCRHLKLDPEAIASHGNHKFLKRFRKLEELAGRAELSIPGASQQQLEELWNAAKHSETE